MTHGLGAQRVAWLQAFILGEQKAKRGWAAGLRSHSTMVVLQAFTQAGRAPAHPFPFF